jgi:hypothetical protein
MKMCADRQRGYCIVFCLVATGAFGHAQGATPSADNPELKQIFDADQKDREGPSVANLDWSKLGARDAVRLKRVRELIEAGRLSTGKDYERAAFVFQHGEGSDDILLAHILAVTAIGKGDLDARWIAAATLDRYLQRIGQPQVFGTQFSFTMENGLQIWTMGEFNRSLVAPGCRMPTAFRMPKTRPQS